MQRRLRLAAYDEHSLGQRERRGAPPRGDVRVITAHIRNARSAKELLDVIAEKLEEPAFNMIHVSTALYMLVNLRRDLPKTWGQDPVVKGLADRARGLLDEGWAGGQALTNSLWSLARLGPGAPTPLKELLSPLTDVAKTLLPDEITAQHASNLLWTVASLKKHPKLRELLPLLSSMVALRMNEFKVRELSSVFWAIATIRAEEPQLRELVPALAEVALSKIKFLRSQEIANIIWAVGVIGVRCEETDALVEALQAKAVNEAQTFTTQGFANTCWGLAVFGQRNEALVHLVATALSERGGQVSWKEVDLALPKIVCAAAKMDVRHDALLQVVEDRVAPTLWKLNHWGLCALLWSFEQLSSSGASGQEGFLQQLREEAQRRGFTDEHVARSREGPEVWWAATVIRPR